jgi:hypothetical protein
MRPHRASVAPEQGHEEAIDRASADRSTLMLPIVTSLVLTAYPAGAEVRRVPRDASIKWTGGYVFVGEAMRDELAGHDPSR